MIDINIINIKFTFKQQKEPYRVPVTATKKENKASFQRNHGTATRISRTTRISAATRISATTRIRRIKI